MYSSEEIEESLDENIDIIYHAHAINYKLTNFSQLEEYFSKQFLNTSGKLYIY